MVLKNSSLELKIETVGLNCSGFRSEKKKDYF